jgi:hypothetical protein
LGYAFPSSCNIYFLLNFLLSLGTLTVGQSATATLMLMEKEPPGRTWLCADSLFPLPNLKTISMRYNITLVFSALCASVTLTRMSKFEAWEAEQSISSRAFHLPEELLALFLLKSTNL